MDCDVFPCCFHMKWDDKMPTDLRKKVEDFHGGAFSTKNDVVFTDDWTEQKVHREFFLSENHSFSYDKEKRKWLRFNGLTWKYDHNRIYIRRRLHDYSYF